MSLILKLLTDNPLINLQNVFYWSYALAIVPTILLVRVSKLINSKVKKAKIAKWQLIYWVTLSCLILFQSKNIPLVAFLYVILTTCVFIGKVRHQKSKSQIIYKLDLSSFRRHVIHSSTRFLQQILKFTFPHTSIKKASFFKSYFLHALIFSILAFNLNLILATPPETNDVLITHFVGAVCIGVGGYFFCSSLIKKSLSTKHKISIGILENILNWWFIIAVPFFSISLFLLGIFPDLSKEISKMKLFLPFEFSCFYEKSLFALLPPVLIALFRENIKQQKRTFPKKFGTSHPYLVQEYIIKKHIVYFFLIYFCLFFIYGKYQFFQDWNLSQIPVYLYSLTPILFLITSYITIPGEILYLKDEKKYVTVWKFGLKGVVVKYSNSSIDHISYWKLMKIASNYSKFDNVNPSFNIPIIREIFEKSNTESIKKIIMSDKRTLQDPSLDEKNETKKPPSKDGKKLDYKFQPNVFYNYRDSQLEIDFWVNEYKKDIPEMIQEFENKIQSYLHELQFKSLSRMLSEKSKEKLQKNRKKKSKEAIS